MNFELRTRQEAIEKKLPWYFTGEPCKRGHIERRITDSTWCYGCRRILRTKEIQPNRYEYLQAYQRNMPVEKKRKRDEVTRHVRKQATPPWADKKAIKAIYAESRQLSLETGIKYTVDHIVPMRGKNASGLHIPFNLRIVPWEENKVKRNAVIEELAIISLSN